MNNDFNENNEEIKFSIPTGDMKIDNDPKPDNNNEKEEKKAKKNIKTTILFSIIFLLIGVISGAFILKSLNKNLDSNSFMYDILSKSGLLMSENKEDLDTATPSDAIDSSDYLNDLVFITEKDNVRYYYYKTDEDDYLYYYAYSYDDMDDYTPIYHYYASDPDGYYLNSTYLDYVEPIKFTVPDFTGKTLDEIEPYGDYYYIAVLYIPNDAYDENEIYYQNVKPGEAESYFYADSNDWSMTEITVVVNASASNNE